MATISFTIPDDKLQRIIDGYSKAHNYQEKVILEVDGVGVPNPESRAAFVKRLVAEHIKRTVLGYEASQSETTLKTEINNIVID